MKKQYIIGAFIICITFTSCEDIDTQSYISILASLMGVCVALIGVCATIIVGFQIASHLDIHDTKKQMESVKAESENVQKDKKEIQEKIEFLETNLSNAFVLVASKSDDNAFKSLAYMTSIYCDSFKNINAKLNAENAEAKEDVNAIIDTYSLLGLFKEDVDTFIANNSKTQDIPSEITELANARWQAKINKDWTKADTLRNELLAKGYIIKDSKDGFEIIPQ